MFFAWYSFILSGKNRVLLQMPAVCLHHNVSGNICYLRLFVSDAGAAFYLHCNPFRCRPFLLLACCVSDSPGKAVFCETSEAPKTFFSQFYCRLWPQFIQHVPRSHVCLLVRNEGNNLFSNTVSLWIQRPASLLSNLCSLRFCYLCPGTLHEAATGLLWQKAKTCRLIQQVL